MKLIYTCRRGGKTTRAVKECLRTGATLVVLNRAWADKLQRQYSNLNVITHDQFMDGHVLEGRGVTIIIDDIDQLLYRFAKGRTQISCVTMSKPFTKADCKKFGLTLDMEGRT